MWKTVSRLPTRPFPEYRYWDVLRTRRNHGAFHNRLRVNAGKKIQKVSIAGGRTHINGYRQLILSINCRPRPCAGPRKDVLL